jgi:hypothetical protein
MSEVEQKNLAGLKFRTSIPKEVDEDGRKKKRHFPIERQLKTSDLLTQRDDGDTFHIVTKDGRKYDILKTPAKNAAKEPGEDAGKETGKEE